MHEPMGRRRCEAERASIPIHRRRFGSNRSLVQAGGCWIEADEWRRRRQVPHVDIVLEEENSCETANDGLGNNHDYFKLAWRRGTRRSR
jgi:hypothetical protein